MRQRKGEKSLTTRQHNGEETPEETTATETMVSEARKELRELLPPHPAQPEPEIMETRHMEETQTDAELTTGTTQHLSSKCR